MMKSKKQITLATLFIVLATMAMDFLFHGQLLMSLYESTYYIWRPMEDVNPSLPGLVTLVYSLIYVLFYKVVVRTKSIVMGGTYGFFVGSLIGVLQLSFYIYLPIPYAMAVSWLGIALFESIVTGFIVGYFVKD